MRFSLNHPSLPTTLGLLTLLSTFARGGDESSPCCSPAKEEILRMNRAELCQLFRSLPEGEVPRAYYRGTLIGKGPAPVRAVTAGAVGVVWQGKYVMPDRGMMINKVCGQAKVTAEIYTDTSWLDHRPVTVFDYRCSSAKFARDARDEVREVCPGLFLGVMWIRQPDGCPKLSTFFLLEKACELRSSTCDSCVAENSVHEEANGSGTTTPSTSP